MSNRFTERAQRVVLISQEEAKRLNHDYVGTEHELLGLIALREGVAAQALANLGIDLRRVRAGVEKITGTGDNVMLLGEIPFTPRAKKVLDYAVEEAAHMGCQYVGTEHLLLGILREEEGVGARVLVELGLSLKRVRTEVLMLLGLQDPTASKKAVAAANTASSRVADLLQILMYEKLCVRALEDAVVAARSLNGKKTAAYATCADLAETLLEP